MALPNSAVNGSGAQSLNACTTVARYRCRSFCEMFGVWKNTNGVPSNSPLRRKPMRTVNASPDLASNARAAKHALTARESSATLLIPSAALAPCSGAAIIRVAKTSPTSLRQNVNLATKTFLYGAPNAFYRYRPQRSASPTVLKFAALRQTPVRSSTKLQTAS